MGEIQLHHLMALMLVSEISQTHTGKRLFSAPRRWDRCLPFSAVDNYFINTHISAAGSDFTDIHISSRQLLHQYLDYSSRQLLHIYPYKQQTATSPSGQTAFFGKVSNPGKTFPFLERCNTACLSN